MPRTQGRYSPSRAGNQRIFLPKPTTPEAIEKALAFHNSQVTRNRPIPHFVDDDGTLFYVDRTGKTGQSRQYFNNLGRKLATEAGRSKRLRDATPKLETYTQVYGNELGTQLYKTEKQRRVNIYSENDPATQDVDHVNSAADGGRNMARNLRNYDKTLNRSEGARALTDRQKIDTLNASTTNEDAIQEQGPEMTVNQTNDYLNNGRVKAWVYADEAAGVNPKTTARNIMKFFGLKPGRMGPRGAAAGIGTVDQRSAPQTVPGSIFNPDPNSEFLESASQPKENPYTITGRGI